MAGRLAGAAAAGSGAAAATIDRARVESTSAADTVDLGARLGSVARAGDLVCLWGELAAGKTQLAKGIARGLGVVDTVNSPTFVLMAEYTGRLPLFHVDLYRLAQAPRASYEVVLDATSGDIVPQVLLERLASNNVAVLQTATSVGTGSSKSLRFENQLPAPVTAEHIRVRGAGCGAACGPDDVYRIRVYETTYSIPRFNNTGGAFTVLLIQNPASYTISGRAWFWDPSGALLHIQPFTLAPKALLALNSAAVPALQGKGGTITVSNDGRYGDLTGKGISLEPATGFAFDTPMEPRPRPYF